MTCEHLSSTRLVSAGTSKFNYAIRDARPFGQTAVGASEKYPMNALSSCFVFTGRCPKSL